VNILLIPCEIGVKTVLPAMRSLMARAIVEKYEMKEKQAAEILGLSQSAISRYSKKNRGNILTIENEPEVQALIDQLVGLLLHVPQQKKEIVKLFCQTCKTIREKGLMCPLCKEKTKKIWAETCTFCL
jgi:predicted transcriptional regulator